MSATVAWDQAAIGYRLLTEAEWEYACRARSTTAFCNGGITPLPPDGQGWCTTFDPNLDQVGWYCVNSSGMTHDVGGKSPKAWGPYDMHGNVHEWCWDWCGTYPGTVTDPTGPASGSTRVVRDGAFEDFAYHLRSANHGHYEPTQYYYVGLRLARNS